MIRLMDKAPSGATHRYEHGGLISWYRETDSGLFVWRDGSWCGAAFKTTEDLMNSCMLGRVIYLPMEQAGQAEDDLTWLARNAHKWPDIVAGRAFAAAFVSDGSVRWLEYPPVDWDGCYRKHEWLARRAELQNKPRWKDAPEWATHLAQDHVGDWLWFSGEPTVGSGGWYGDNALITRGEVLGDWRDTLEQRPIDLSEPAVTERLNEATQNVLAAVPGLMDEKYLFEHNTKPVSVANETVQLEQPGVVAGTGARSHAQQAFLIGRVIDLLRTSADHFSADELADLNELTGAELTKRDAAVCGGEHGRKFVLVLGDGTFGLVESGGLTWTLSLERATLMAEAGWEQFKRFGKLAEVRHGKLVVRVGGAA